MDEIRKALEEVAQAHGGTVHEYPPSAVHRETVRTVDLRDIQNEDGKQYEAASLKDDGSLVVFGWDSGPRVSRFFGEDITSYEWTYVVSPERVAVLVEELGGGDVLELLAGYYDEHNGVISPLLRSEKVDAEFSNWHS